MKNPLTQFAKSRRDRKLRRLLAEIQAPALRVKLELDCAVVPPIDARRVVHVSRDACRLASELELDTIFGLRLLPNAKVVDPKDSAH
jgi:hypothetical protein